MTFTLHGWNRLLNCYNSIRKFDKNSIIIIVNNHNVFKIEIPANTLIFVKNQTFVHMFLYYLPFLTPLTWYIISNP